MIRIKNLEHPRRFQNKTIAFSLRLFAAGLFLALFAVSSARGQTFTYSSSWTTGAGPDDVQIFGSGISENNYNSPDHYVEVSTTISSPAGRAAASSASSATYAYAETFLLWDWNNEDPGDYYVSSDHHSFCPYYNGGEFYGYTFSVIPIGIARDAYQLLSETFVGGRFGNGVADFEPTCYGRCTISPEFGTDKVTAGFAPEHIQCRTLVVFSVCLQFSKICLGIPGAGDCN